MFTKDYRYLRVILQSYTKNVNYNIYTSTEFMKFTALSLIKKKKYLQLFLLNSHKFSQNNSSQIPKKQRNNIYTDHKENFFHGKERKKSLENFPTVKRHTFHDPAILFLFKGNTVFVLHSNLFSFSFAH